MLTYQCINCGNPITVEDHERVGKCSVCGSLFVFPNQYANKENIYRLGRDALESRNFDLALTYYSRILKIDAIETEAHWGYLLSKYGVEIRMDAMHRHDVLFHRMERTLFTDDPSYARLIEYCPKDALYYYQTLAEKVAAKQRQMFRIAKNMGEFDVYVNCVAQPGTADYMMASQVTDALVDAGYQVFNPSIDLYGGAKEDKNLFEMAAAEKAKAMIVVVTRSTDKQDPRYQAVWKRYLAYRRQDANRKMLSIYRDILPDKDLPLELQPLQSIECGGQNFQDHVLAEINTMFGRQNRDAGLTRQILELLRQGDRALAEKQFREAATAYEQVKKLDAEEVRAHWGLVCAATDNLQKPKLSDTLDANYKLAVQFAEGPQKEAYRKTMSALMTDAAWNGLLTVTDQFKNSAVEESDSVKAAIARVYLYMPKSDTRLAQIDKYHELCKMDREADALHKAYWNCDVMANPRFGEHLAACNEYRAIQSSGLHDFFETVGGMLPFYLIGSLILFSLSWAWGLFGASASTFGGFVYSVLYFGSYLFGLLLFFGALAVLFVVAWFIPVIAGVAFLIFGRAYAPYLILVNLVVLIGLAIFMLLASNSVRSAASRKKAARKKLEAMEQQLAVEYQADMKAIYTKYGYPDHDIAHFHMNNHADMIDNENRGGKKAKKKFSPVTYAVVIVVFLVAYSFLFPMLMNNHFAKGWENIVDIYVANNTVIGLREDGTVVANGSNENRKIEVEEWTDIVQIVAGADYTAGLKSDGTLMLSSKLESFYHDKKYFTDVVELSGCLSHLIGLRSDGTLAGTGWNGNRARDVGDYTDVKQALAMMHDSDYFGASKYMTVIVTGDGKVHMTPLEGWDDIRLWLDNHTGSEEGQYHVERVHGYYSGKIILETTDGVCHGVGGYSEVEQEGVNSWNANEIKEFFVGDSVLALKHDGTLLCAGDNASINTDISNWPKVEDIAGGYYHVLGLKEDGTVVAAGDTTYGRCEVEEWKNVERIYTGMYNSYGITEDGHIYAAGKPEFGMTYLSNKNIFGVLKYIFETTGE